MGGDNTCSYNVALDQEMVQKNLVKGQTEEAADCRDSVGHPSNGL